MSALAFWAEVALLLFGDVFHQGHEAFEFAFGPEVLDAEAFERFGIADGF